MPVHGTVLLTPSSPAESVHIRRDAYSGRKYHASFPLSENTDLLGTCAPYSYTIWKRFRNEVCAECWRYERGRKAFLTRRDDEGLEGIGHHTSSGDLGASPRAVRDKKTATHTGTGAGLWFCDEQCQQQWIAREGIDTVHLLRRLEGARQKKNKASARDVADPQREVTQEVVDRAWDLVHEREGSPKEVRKWRDLRLDDYETDMARYVLLALSRYYREQMGRHHPLAQLGDLPLASPLDNRDRILPEAANGEERAAAPPEPSPETASEQGSGWETFAALQANELSLIRACPEILEHQTRIYQVLRGRFGPRSATQSVMETSPRSWPSSASPPSGFEDATSVDECGQDRREPELADVVTLPNVRTALGVDPGNSFGIWEVPLTDESECLGFAVYPVASFFNHHCSPNVRKEREGRNLRFLTTCSVEEGEELCISYGHVGDMSRSDRQRELLEGWYFVCQCSRCLAEAAGHGT